MQSAVFGKTTPFSSGPKRSIQSICEIRLTQGHVAIVDPEDFERFGKLNWCALIDFKTGNVYAARDSKTTLLHRAILDAPKGMLVDHINRNTLDCRRSNLRFATRQQNLLNRRFNRVAASGFIGVQKRGSRYQGAVMLSGRKHFTTTFDCPILAAAARDVLAQQLHGDFATLNFEFRRVA